MINQKKRLGDLLLETGLITQNQLNHVLQIQKSTGKKLGELFIDEGILTEEQIIEVLEFQFGIPHMDLDKYYIDPDISKLIPESLARKYILIPIRKEKKRLMVAMADPLNILAIDDVRIATGYEVDPIISSKKDILNAIDQYYGKENAERAIEDFKKNYNLDNISELDEEIINEINNAPVVRLVNSIIKQAINARASDIHIEPFEDILRIRFRIDGDLQEVMRPAKQTHGAIVTRIKIMAKMNIAERRLPQDGRVEMESGGKELDLRISTIPTIYGEKVVMRILDRSNFLKDRSQLGFYSENLKRFDEVIKNNNGIILVTGPTGSGKSTTLYTILSEINKTNNNIITVEDPVEYRMHGINQVQVNSKAGLTFASGLKSMLRQDPDIIMVGEIRDGETAEMSIRAAVTGHLVLSTLHTNSAPATINRLLDMGIEAYLVASTVVGVVAQRLVKKICPSCKEAYKPDNNQLSLLGVESNISVLYKGKGCSHCGHTGYKGRGAIHEIMIVDKKIRKMIIDSVNNDTIKDYAIKEGMITLQQNCRELVISGETTVEEFLKVAYSLEG